MNSTGKPMCFWIVLARDGMEAFEPFKSTSEGQAIVYRSRGSAKQSLIEAKQLFGNKNAYLQKLGPIR
jgi:hypothetical protein